MDINTFNFNDFSQVGSLNFNGTAQQIGNNLDLNALGNISQAGSVFYNNPFNFDSSTSFSTHFESQIEGKTGITFLLQNDPRGVNALGEPARSYGYGNGKYDDQNNQIIKSVAIELTNFSNSSDNNNAHVAVLLNGNVFNSLSSFSLETGEPVDTWVDYNAATQNLSVYVSNTPIKPTNPLFSYTVDLTQVLGNQFYTGFTAGSREQPTQPTDNINNWSFTTQPEYTPPSASLVASSGTANIIQSNSDPYSYTFNVTYQDSTTVETATLDNQDIQVTGPNGFSELATVNSFTSNPDQTQVMANCTVNAPSGSWNLADNGTYTITLLPNQVSDIYGNLTPTTTLGTFQVNINQDVLTQGNNTTRSEIDPNETILNTNNVNDSQFGKVSQLSVDGQVYAQPLYVSGISIKGELHNVVYIATMHNSIYAYDADNYSLLWVTHLGNAVHLPDPNIGGGDDYDDIKGEVGILSTPVISADGTSMYFVDMQKINGQYSYQLHDINTVTGADQIAPVTIAATVLGIGDGGQITFTPNLQDQRTALLLANGNVYFAFASFTDVGLYHGWVFSYSATNLTQQAVYNDSPSLNADSSGNQGGIWQAGTGLSADSSGNIYLLTGSGPNTFNNSNLQLGEYADSFLKLSPTLQIEDYFTPSVYAALDEYDQDLGSGNVTFIPGTNLITGVGKQGTLYVLDSNDLGHEVNNDTQIVQEFTVANNEVYGTPVYYDGQIYISSLTGNITAYTFNGADFNTSPSLTSTTPYFTYPGAQMSISSDGNQAGILWALGGDTNPELVAYDPTTLQPLWTSNDSSSDQLQSAAKFNRPTIANGRVYVATFSNIVDVYGLL